MRRDIAPILIMEHDFLDDEYSAEFGNVYLRQVQKADPSGVQAKRLGRTNSHRGVPTGT